MKYFILLLVLLSMCFADEHRLLVTGFTKHETSSRPDGEKFNEFNYGGGYEYTSFKDYDKFYFASNITVIRDSFDKPQYTFSVSSNIRYRLSANTAISFGVAGFVMYKDEVYRANVTAEDSKYIVVFGAAPLASLYYKSLSVNFAYIPTVAYKDINPTGFAIMYFGWIF